MSWFEELSVFTSGEFSVEATVESPTAINSTVSGIFDERHEPMLDMYGGVEGTGLRITFKVQTSDIDGLRHSDAMAIAGKTYLVAGIHAVGDGKITELTLKENG